MSFKHVTLCFLLCCFSMVPVQIGAASDPDNPRKVQVDVDRKYTSVGNIGMTVTNFGTIGTGNFYWPKQPSCEYPRGSLIEHIYRGALWIGGVPKTRDTTDIRDGIPVVSTGATDRSGEGFELNPEVEDSITELSILGNDRPPTSQFSASAVSHQDFVCDYGDHFTHFPVTGDTILNHTPMGLRVHQESYAWNYPYVNFFVILHFVIYNTSVDTLDSVYVGYWANGQVHNTNNFRPGSAGYFEYTLNGFDPNRRIAYSFDKGGEQGGGPADSYVGIKLLGAVPFPAGVDSIGNLRDHTYYNAWQFRASSGDPAYFSPRDDYNSDPNLSRYSRMTQSLPQDKIDRLRVAKGNSNQVSPVDITHLLTTGPFRRLNPGDSLEVDFAIVCAKMNGGWSNSDSASKRVDLNDNAEWAQKAYQGEDVNGNNFPDLGEDFAGRSPEFGFRYEPDGRITHYLLPSPPRPPKVRTEVLNNSVIVYWDKSNAEESIDPLTHSKDFEGYHIYRSIAASDFLNHDNFISNLPLVADFDRIDNIGYNTGFGKISLDSEKVFPGDTVKYWYRFPPKGENVPSLNGWQYMYAVSAYDMGDSAHNVDPIESAPSFHRVIPGTLPTSSSSVDIGVYPNPYYVNAIWDGGRERLRKIYFYNLPAQCDITIYTLAGDVVTVLDHDAQTNNGEGIEWFNQFGNREVSAEFSGGQHAWDLITRSDQAIATGLYLFTVKDHNTGQIKRGKFLVVK